MKKLNMQQTFVEQVGIDKLKNLLKVIWILQVFQEMG
jgi:hypothetical protein